MQYTPDELIEKARSLPDILSTYEQLIETVNAMSTFFGDDPHSASYWLASLKIATSSGHGYVTRDTNAGQALSELADDIHELLNEERWRFETAGIDITELIDTIEQCMLLGEE